MLKGGTLFVTYFGLKLTTHDYDCHFKVNNGALVKSTQGQPLATGQNNEGQRHLGVDVMEQVLHTKGVMSLFGYQMMFQNRPVHSVHIFICNYANFTPLGPKIFELFIATTKVVEKIFPPTNW
jgi:hypothetical protein